MSLNNGMPTLVGFSMKSSKPLDTRFKVDTTDDLVTLVDSGLSYEGLIVYVDSSKQSVIWNGSKWCVIPVDIDKQISDIQEQMKSKVSYFTVEVYIPKGSWVTGTNGIKANIAVTGISMKDYPRMSIAPIDSNPITQIGRAHV